MPRDTRRSLISQSPSLSLSYLFSLLPFPSARTIEFLIFTRSIDYFIVLLILLCTIEAIHVNKRNKKWKTEENKCERNGFILVSFAYASALVYARVERREGLKRRERKRETGEWVSRNRTGQRRNVNGETPRGRRSAGKGEGEGDRLSCRAAVNLRGRDVEAADFFCASPLICTSDYLNWLEQS